MTNQEKIRDKSKKKVQVSDLTKEISWLLLIKLILIILLAVFIFKKCEPGKPADKFPVKDIFENRPLPGSAKPYLEP